jgi:hypothetical protein
MIVPDGSRHRNHPETNKVPKVECDRYRLCYSSRACGKRWSGCVSARSFHPAMLYHRLRRCRRSACADDASPVAMPRARARARAHPEHHLRCVPLRTGPAEICRRSFLCCACGQCDGMCASSLAGRELIAIEFEKQHAHHEAGALVAMHERMLLNDTDRAPRSELDDVRTRRGSVIE